MRTALVLGGASSVWSDVKAALALGEFSGVVTCNDVTALWPGPIDAAASLHSDSWARWLTARDRKGYPRPAQVFGHLEAQDPRRPRAGVTAYTDYRFPGQDRSGSSGLFALKVALIDLGFDRAVLCGMPMDAKGAHFFDPKPWMGFGGHRKGWAQALPSIKDRARSMSGWTRELLGAPTPEWLNP